MADFKAQKAELRANALAKRDGLSVEIGVQAAQALAKMIDHIAISPNAIVSGFWPIRSEIDPRPLMDGLRAKGARLCLPAVIDRHTIIFRCFDDEAELEPASFGTFAPGPDAEVLDPEIMLVPLSTFDNHGNRIGYGAGHYDRAIAKLVAKGKKPLLIGLSFSCQKVAQVPAEPHDVPLDGIITEQGLLWFGSGSNSF